MSSDNLEWVVHNAWQIDSRGDKCMGASLNWSRMKVALHFPFLPFVTRVCLFSVKLAHKAKVKVVADGTAEHGTVYVL